MERIVILVMTVCCWEGRWVNKVNEGNYVMIELVFVVRLMRNSIRTCLRGCNYSPFWDQHSTGLLRAPIWVWAVVRGRRKEEKKNMKQDRMRNRVCNINNTFRAEEQQHRRTLRSAVTYLFNHCCGCLSSFAD